MPVGKADVVEGSCKSSDGTPLCGGPSEGACYCDDECASFGDCCKDAPGTCGVGYRGECTVTDEGVAVGCGSDAFCILDNCDPECDLVSADCCEGVCETVTDPQPIPVECTITDEGVSLGCDTNEICIFGPCDPECEIASADCCDASCHPIDDSPVAVECTITDEGVSLGCDDGDICVLGPCADGCDIVTPDCCEAQCVPFEDQDPTAVECLLEDGVSLGCDEGEICTEACVEDCTGAGCCFNVCEPI